MKADEWCSCMCGRVCQLELTYLRSHEVLKVVASERCLTAPVHCYASEDWFKYSLGIKL